MAMQLKNDEGEILGLTVKEISHVIAPAVDGVLKGQQLDACYLIVKENDPEDDDDDTGDIDVLLKKDAMSTDSAAPLRPEAKQGKCAKCGKEMTGEDACKCVGKEWHEIVRERCQRTGEVLHKTTTVGADGNFIVKQEWVPKEDTPSLVHKWNPPNGVEVIAKGDLVVTKEPVVQNTEMVTPTVTDETKMELQRTLKELVANSGGMKSGSRMLLAKVAAYHGVDVPDVEEEQESEDTSLDDVLAALQKLVPVIVALQPKPAPAPPAASPAPKPAATASASMAKKEDVVGDVKFATFDQLKNVFPEMIEAAGGLGKAETTTLAEEIRTETTKELVPTEEPLLTRVARILEKQREQYELDEYMSVLKEAAKKIQGVQNEYIETKRSLLKAMGRDPNDLEAE